MNIFVVGNLYSHVMKNLIQPAGESIGLVLPLCLETEQWDDHSGSPSDGRSLPPIKRLINEAFEESIINIVLFLPLMWIRKDVQLFLTGSFGIQQLYWCKRPTWVFFLKGRSMIAHDDGLIGAVVAKQRVISICELELTRISIYSTSF